MCNRITIQSIIVKYKWTTTVLEVILLLFISAFNRKFPGYIKKCRRWMTLSKYVVPGCLLMCLAFGIRHTISTDAQRRCRIVLSISCRQKLSDKPNIATTYQSYKLVVGTAKHIVFLNIQKNKQKRMSDSKW